jgi:hypothetical protein
VAAASGTSNLTLPRERESERKEEKMSKIITYSDMEIWLIVGMWVQFHLLPHFLLSLFV